VATYSTAMDRHARRARERDEGWRKEGAWIRAGGRKMGWRTMAAAGQGRWRDGLPVCVCCGLCGGEGGLEVWAEGGREEESGRAGDR